MGKLHHPHAGLLIIRSNNHTMVPLSKDVTTLGRKQADIILDDSKTSSTHAEIRRQGTSFILKDLGSTNGTHVNRKPIQQAELADQDVIEIGNTTLCFYFDLREFHGAQAEVKPTQFKTDAEATKTREILTTSKTIRQSEIRLEVIDGPDKGKKFSFRKSQITIGRKSSDIVLNDTDISRSHALIEVFSPKSTFIRDLDSTNGTFLNKKKIKVEKLKSGDEISVGNSVLCISLENTEASDKTLQESQNAH